MAIVKSIKQKGVVLITSLLMIIAVTSIAVTLMSSSSIDIKMTSAAQENEVAEYWVRGDSERAINQEMIASANSRFLFLTGQFPADNTTGIDVTVAGSKSTVTLFNNNNGPVLLNCPPRIAVTNGIKCNTLRVESSLAYGKDDKHSVTLISGIAQELGIVGQSQ
ncbi:hypothetical protein CJF42_15525 [Pseudoalteromonas sp. NBT06-2]|uniref:pilus assembly PilX family protein n=1 Tax=Pseudoalteromonas sp. NBT06-2 TaxID=2025950 RepID=UPI000BA63841|nr:pilus assembly protein PilX [Pseudoalteromonas sp. NBT06-2]PAJ73464.1 hypothetical protein CJF42_15525 [Pseudoalteromonas sp. NBT06-2]